MPSRTLKLLTAACAACAAFALQTLPGCQTDNGGGGSSARTTTADRSSAAVSGNAESRATNQQTAQALLREAEEAERQGKYQVAMEKYQYLRAFPEPSRPDDLDARMDRLRQRMNNQGGR